ncbi:hypothetical protein ANN_22440 [Periplaneta americana]|uniref:Reverse transcriptase zinc-binding domain-containing protein n=1 Tax=Periplaneta americana TaxID=6978 RepID=A0ABQ8S857_PERAM|nr:hypothetical protein ANN_22440 [Periplaneta americana]
MTVCGSFDEMIEVNWTKTTALTRAALFQQIHRNLNLFETVWHVNVFCLSKLWYLAQILPLPDKYATVLERAVSFYIWKGYLYKLKKTQLCLPKGKGGLQLIAVKEKCQALITRNILRGQRGESDPMDNDFWERQILPFRSRKSPLPKSIQSLWQLIESYPPELITSDTKQQTKLIYKHIMENNFQSPRITEQFPNQRWHKIWHNIHLANIPTAWQTTVYCYINHIIPTEERKHQHHLTDSSACKTCGYLDTLKHRITNCGTAKTTWDGAKHLLQQIWPTSQLNDKHQTLLLVDPPSENAVFVKVWLAAGFLHYQLTASVHTMEELLKMFATERHKFEQKCNAMNNQNLQQLKSLHL